MALRSSVGALAIAAVCAALSLAACAPASAATAPNTGAVIFNTDGTPIGSQLVYGAGATPQFVYTSTTSDDDAWGLTGGVPAHTTGVDPTAGLPIGFGVNVGGTTFDQVAMNSNGGLCFVAPVSVEANLDQCTDIYYQGVSTIGASAARNNPTADFSALLPLNADQDPRRASTPVDANADSVPESCTYGSYLFSNAGNFYCSSVSWGTTTYEGKAAFAATWYHDPNYSDGDLSHFNTYQVIIVDNGGGNALIVYNYDDTNNSGQTTSNLTGESEAQATACADSISDPTRYSTIGLMSYNAATTAVSQLDFFGPACVGGLTPTPSADLMTGGASQLSTHSLNSAVAGRYAYAIVDGIATLTLPAAVAVAVVAVTPALAATGVDLTFPILVGLLLLSIGIAILVGRATRTSNT